MASLPSRVLFVTFPKSGTGLLHAIRGIESHVDMFTKNEDFKSDDEYINEVLACDICTGHIPYSESIQKELKKNGVRIIFIIRNLADVAISLMHYLELHEGSELNIMVNGFRLSRTEDKLLECIKVVANWWDMFSGWLDGADAVYSYRDLRGAALLMGRENDSFSFITGNINYWRKEFKPHHIELARQILPDVMREYYRGIYE